MRDDHTYFPIIKNELLRSGLKIDYIGKYSISLPKDSNIISKIIKIHMKRNNIIITDATAGVGGNTISFSKNFKKVNAIEIDKTRYEYLINNIRIYNGDNVLYYNDNYLNCWDDINQDVIFIDPPWGGKKYKFKNNIRLTLSSISIEKICNNIIERNKAKLIIIKLPLNYDLLYFYKKVKGVIYNYNMNRMIILCIEK